MHVRIKFQGALGDVVASTALVRDLKRSNPTLQISVDTPFPEVYYRNPYLTNVDTPVDRLLEISEADYRAGVQQASAGRRWHFLEWFCELASQRLGLPCPLTEARPYLVLDIPRWPNVPWPQYWVIFAGGKTDITVKHWSFDRYQELVGQLLERGVHLVQTGRSQDIHPPLYGAHDLVGHGGPMELFELIYHAAGVICPITSGMHIAAAFGKPCVVLAGGREEPWWAAYNKDFGSFAELPIATPHRFLHTIGQLDCCLRQGCWKRRLWGTGPESCLARVSTERQTLPACMEMLQVRMVVDAVLSYDAAHASQG